MSRQFEPRPGFTVQAYQFALDPTEQQAAALASHCGGQRVAFNWGLAQVKCRTGADGGSCRCRPKCAATSPSRPQLAARSVWTWA